MQQQQAQAQAQAQALMLNSIPPSLSSTSITTEQIQKLLDENKQLIMSILENQNMGKLAECAQYQSLLQKNLMYLAAIADAQPQVQVGPPQATPPSAVQQGQFLQYAQALATPQQQGMFSPQLPFQLSNQQQQQQMSNLHQQQQQMSNLHQQQQFFQAQFGMRPGANNSMHQALQNGLNPSSSLGGAQGSRHDGSGAPGEFQGRHGGGD